VENFCLKTMVAMEGSEMLPVESEGFWRRVCIIVTSRGTGTGFLASHHGHTFVFTCNHVSSSESADLTATFDFDGRLKTTTIRLTKLVITDENLDFSVFEFDDSNCRENIRGRGAWDLNRAESHSVVEGEPIQVCGHPEGNHMHLSRGNVTAVPPNEIAHNASTNRGSSGSPVLDSRNEPVGLHKAGDEVLRVNVATLISSVVRRLRHRLEHLDRQIIAYFIAQRRERQGHPQTQAEQDHCWHLAGVELAKRKLAYAEWEKASEAKKATENQDGFWRLAETQYHETISLKAFCLWQGEGGSQLVGTPADQPQKFWKQAETEYLNRTLGSGPI